jgi:hypothetical protein
MLILQGAGESYSLGQPVAIRVLVFFSSFFQLLVFLDGFTFPAGKIIGLSLPTSPPISRMVRFPHLNK